MGAVAPRVDVYLMGQIVQTEVPTWLPYLPTGQKGHAVAAVALFAYVPTPQRLHEEAPAGAEYPVAHAVALLEEPAEKYPAGTVVQAFAVPLLEAKVPAGQPVHVPDPIVEKRPTGQGVLDDAPAVV